MSGEAASAMCAMCVLTGGHIWSWEHHTIPELVALFDRGVDVSKPQPGPCGLCRRPWAPTARTQRPPSGRILTPSTLFSAAVVVWLVALAVTSHTWWQRALDGALAVVNAVGAALLWRPVNRRRP